MFSNLTYSKKNRVLIAGIVVFALLAYIFAFNKTIKLSNENRNLKNQLAQIENAPQRISALNHQLDELDTKLGYIRGDGALSQEAILSYVSNYCISKNIFLKEFSEPEISENSGYTVETNILQIEGSYAEILTLIYEIEHVERLSKIASLQFKKTKDRKTKRDKLIAAVHFQNINKLKNEI